MTLQSDIDIIARQESALRFKSVSEDDAWKLGCVMRETALARKLPLVIDIRLSNKPLFYVAMPGTTPENPDWVRRKVNTVLRFERSSYRVGLEYKLRGVGFDSSRGLDVMNFASAGGGFPIQVIGAGVVGAVTVSGLPQREDHAFVVASLAKHLGVSLDGLALPEQESHAG